MSKTASVVIEGEALDLLIGSRPLPEKKAKGKTKKDKMNGAPMPVDKEISAGSV